MRKALKATGLLFKVPRQISAAQPHAAAISPRFSIPRSNPIELGSSPVSLEIFPRVATNFGSFARSVGAAYSWQSVFGRISGDSDSTNLINDFQ